MKKNRFKHCLLMLLMLAFSSSVAAQNQQLTAKQLSEKADEALEKEDYKEALKWIRMAAEKGDLSSQELLSTLLENGDEEFGVEKNEGEALMWLTKAAEAGSASAQMTLARKYEEGKMVAQSYEEAIRWYEKAAKKNEYAIVCLKEIYEKLGSQSDAAGLYNLGKLYHAENAYQEAAKWYRMAAEKDLASAMFSMGKMYAKGNGVAKDYQEAVKWYRMVLEVRKDEFTDMFKIGELYYLRGLTKRGLPDDKKELEGEVVDFDKGDGLNSFAEAQKWFNKVIETCNRISEDAKTPQLGKAAAVMMSGNAEMYLGIVKKAIDRGK